jgi:segregation and condensation protein A
MSEEDYRVQLDIYNGPMDLLLYLIRREEVDIYDIPIARITDQYLEYVHAIHALDPNLAGEFLVMASMLMEIKSRMLLPRPAEEEVAGEEIDPRSELVRQLLEYKRFKDAASWLSDAADEQAKRFPRIPALATSGRDEVDMDDIHIWDLVEAFSKLLQATLASVGLNHEVEKDDTPLALHQDDILDRLQREGPLPFSKIFEGKTRRTEIIGMFLAMLELIRQGLIRIEQDTAFAEIYLFLKVELPEDQKNAVEPAGESSTPAENSVPPPAATAAESSASPEQSEISASNSPAVAEPSAAPIEPEISGEMPPVTGETPAVEAVNDQPVEDADLDDDDEDKFTELDELNIDSRLWDKKIDSTLNESLDETHDETQ